MFDINKIKSNIFHAVFLKIAEEKYGKQIAKETNEIINNLTDKELILIDEEVCHCVISSTDKSILDIINNIKQNIKQNKNDSPYLLPRRFSCRRNRFRNI